MYAYEICLAADGLIIIINIFDIWNDVNPFQYNMSMILVSNVCHAHTHTHKHTTETHLLTHSQSGLITHRVFEANNLNGCAKCLMAPRKELHIKSYSVYDENIRKLVR